MKTWCRRKLAVVAAAALWAVPIFAQGQGGSQGFGQGSGQGPRTSSDSPNDPSTLLTAEAVQKELALTDDQKARLQKLRDERTAEGQAFFAKLMGLPQNEIQKRLEERAKLSRKQIAQILTPKQMERLNEINIQVAGITALGFEDVAEKIGLSADQKVKLKTLGDDTGRRLTELFPTSQAQLRDEQARQERKKKLAEITSERKDKAVALLTDEQQVKFEQLKGEQFDLSSIHVTNKSFSARGRNEAPGRPPAQ